MKLTLDALIQELDSWLQNYGNGRNENDLRFGQYIWSKYDLRNEDFEGPDGFYSEDPTIAFEQLSTVCE